MYKEYFGLLDEPFRMTPDTRYLFKSHRYEEALASLLYGIREKKGFIVITGEIGTGKTTLVRSLLNQLDPTIRTAVILNPILNRSELIHAILDDLDVELKMKNPSLKTLLDRLNRYLIDEAREGANVAVIIDEAQNLDAEVLESIRMLSNLETEQEKLLQIILVGQPELNEILKSPKMEQLRQRIAVRYHITPLEREEIPLYIAHRLEVAGHAKAAEFTSEALDAIADYTRGTPRLINVIGDKCLLAAYACETKTVTRDLALKAIADHEGPSTTSVPERPRIAWTSPSRPRPTSGKRVPRWAAPLVATVIVGLVLLVGVLARRGGEPARPEIPPPPATTAAPTLASILADPAPAAPSSEMISTPSVLSPPVEAAPPVVENTPLRSPVSAATEANLLPDLLRLWGVESNASEITAAGMAEVRLLIDLPTVARLGLPALVRFGDGQRLLVGADPMRYHFAERAADGTTLRRAAPRAAGDAVGLVEARIPLPSHWALPSDPATDPRFKPLLEAALRRQFGDPALAARLLREGGARAAIQRFQAATGLPIDGIVGPLTWCALVARAHPDFPSLAR
jgi:general secretion pathway protein A